MSPIPFHMSAHVYTIQDSKNAPYRKIMHARPGVQVNSARQELSWLPVEGEDKLASFKKGIQNVGPQRQLY